MKIENIKVNGFGKVKDKEVNFKDGINIVYGENESGKSTILKFVEAMLYGAAKTKNGKSISDFDKFKPWDGSEFSGKIEYTLDNGERYEVFRDFKKKNPVIYNSSNEDISKKFGVDKSKGINFFEEQVGIDETSFCSTAMIAQKEIELGKADANKIVQKISNLVSTGDDNISFKKSMDKLNKMQNDTVGTERTKNKPINVVDENIKKLLENKKNLISYQENTKHHVEDRERINGELEELQAKKELLKDVKEYSDKRKRQDIEIEFEKNLETDYFSKAEEIKQKINLKKEINGYKNTRFKGNIYTYMLLFFVLLAVIVVGFVRNTVIDLLSLIPILVVLGLMRMKKYAESKNFHRKNDELAKEYEIALSHYNQKKKEVKEKQKNLELENTKIQKSIAEKYRKKVNGAYIESTMNLADDEIQNEIDMIFDKIQELNIQNRMLENEKSNIDEKLEELTRIEEKLQEQQAIKDELISLDTSFHIAKECLENAYNEIKHNISPRFQQKLCEITDEITGGKYKKISINDETGLKIEIENGEYMPVDRLSVGTIDEMYLSLRLSTLSEISKENLPIILDETFAYFDNHRLENILRYLQDRNYNNQIIILTCSNREENALNELKIEYNLINLEK